MIGSLTVQRPGAFMVNRVAFITGASRGIGRAAALAMARAGYDVVAAARSIESAAGAKALDESRAVNPTALAVNIDLASSDSIKEAFVRATKEKGRIDILVNNAGITRDGLAVRMKPADWEAVLRTNL